MGCGAGCRGSELGPAAARRPSTIVRELTPAPGALALPLRDGSVRFAVIGDSGRGDTPQHEVAQQMVAWRARFPFDFVVMLGDNIYGPHTRAMTTTRKFEDPTRRCSTAGVTFHAAIGNHDDPGQINYAKFNMGGRRYYTFREVRTPAGGAGRRRRPLLRARQPLVRSATARLAARGAGRSQVPPGRSAIFHHPLYTSGRYRTGARALRLALEPILVDGDVDVVLSGHEHFYERLSPQHGISYFISGGAGSLRRGDIRPSASPRAASTPTITSC